MNPFKSPQIIYDHIWKPLVYVSPNQRAFLVHPGTTIKAQELMEGWHWHWPLLTSIRQVSSEKAEFRFCQQRNSSSYDDEPITAVSRDHHLFTSQGRLIVSVDITVPAEVLSQLNHHAPKRLIRPLIRQLVRQAIADFEAKTVTPSPVSSRLSQIAQPLFAQHGLLVHQIELSDLEHYQPRVTQ